MKQILENIEVIMKRHFPDNVITNIKDRGNWVKNIVEITLEDSKTVFLKIQTNPEWTSVKHEANVVEFFKLNGLPAPSILAYDYSCEIISYPYIIQEGISGTKLQDVIRNHSEDDIIKVYKIIGEFYKTLHGFKNDSSGLWGNTPRDILYPIAPNDFMLKAEIINGSGKKARDRGFISDVTYNRIISIWEKNIDYLKDHEPSLVHISPFLWNIYFNKLEDNWIIVKIMSLGDVMWWDTAYDLATIKYPPFGEFNQSRWDAFLDGYGEVPEIKRLCLYELMHYLCTMMGVYLEPKTEENYNWKNRKLANMDKHLNCIIDNIEKQ